MLEQAIQELKGILRSYCGLVEQMIRFAAEGVLQQRPQQLETVLTDLEIRCDNFELEIDEKAMEVIALHGPRAQQLRTVITIMKIANDLERIGDHAVNIANSGLILQKSSFQLEEPIIQLLTELARQCLEMFANASDAFFASNARKAENVIEQDNRVDQLRDEILDALIRISRANLGDIFQILQVINISQNLERVADLCTNIAEDVIFAVEGRIIRHQFVKSPEDGAPTDTEVS